MARYKFYIVLYCIVPNKLVFPFGGSYVCDSFCENGSRNATMRVPTDGHTHWLTDANGFYNLSHAICYSYGTDYKERTAVQGDIMLVVQCYSCSQLCK